MKPYLLSVYQPEATLVNVTQIREVAADTVRRLLTG
jgi:hypothetical protein